jgi:hypothetical protein
VSWPPIHSGCCSIVDDVTSVRCIAVGASRISSRRNSISMSSLFKSAASFFLRVCFLCAFDFRGDDVADEDGVSPVVVLVCFLFDGDVCGDVRLPPPPAPATVVVVVVTG